MLISRDDIVYIATKHKKEDIFRPLFEKVFNCSVTTLPVDTDKYGTFTGETKRKLNQKETADAKARNAAKTFKKRFVVASEGSFFPDPASFGILTLNHEIVVLYDAHKDTFYRGEHTTYDVCAQKSAVRKIADLNTFLKNLPENQEYILSYRSFLLLGKKRFIKDLPLSDIKTTLKLLLSRWWITSISIETDMRAHRNALRKFAIHKAAENLITNITQ